MSGGDAGSGETAIEALGAALVDHWGLRVCGDAWTRIPNGRHYVYLLERPEGPLIVKMAYGAEGLGIRREAWLLSLLAATDAPVAQLVPTRSGAAWASVGDLHIMLSVAIDGSPAREDPGGFAQVGTALRRLHGAMDAIDPNHLASIPQLVPERVVESSAARIEWQLDADDDRQRLHRIAEYVVDRLGAERNAWGEPALCHGDSHFRNVIVTPKHEAVWIDFEDAWIGPRVYDLATVVWSTLRHRSTRPLWESALRAYARAMPEVRIAARSLGTFMVVRQLWWLTLHASRWDASVPRARRQTFLRQGLVLAEIICRDACGGSCAFPESQPLERGPSDASMRRRGLR